MKQKKNDSVWVVTGFSFYTDDDDKPQLDTKMQFLIRDHDIGIFTTQAKAEEYLQHHCEETREYETWMGFMINEKRLDRTPALDIYYQHCASYDANGKLIATTNFDERQHFYGRKKQIPFAPGDIVVVPHNDHAYPVMLVSLPPDEKWWREHMQAGAAGDWSDDSALTVSWKNGHDHPSATNIFPYPGDVPKYVRDCLEEEHIAYMNGKL